MSTILVCTLSSFVAALAAHPDLIATVLEGDQRALNKHAEKTDAAAQASLEKAHAVSEAAEPNPRPVACRPKANKPTPRPAPSWGREYPSEL